MGGLQRGTPAHLQARGDALHNGAFAGADGGLGTAGVVVSLQIHGAHKALTDGAVHLGTLHINIAMYFSCQNGMAVVLHRAADALQACVLLRGAEIGLRQDDVQGAGLVFGALLGALPILRLGGELVNSDAGPRVQRNTGGRQ